MEGHEAFSESVDRHPLLSLVSASFWVIREQRPVQNLARTYLCVQSGSLPGPNRWRPLQPSPSRA